VIEQKVDLSLLEGFRINLREHSAVMYDNFISNILKSSNQYSFLSYHKMERLRRTPMPVYDIPAGANYTGGVYIAPGSKLCKINFEIDSVQVNYFRKQLSIW